MYELIYSQKYKKQFDKLSQNKKIRVIKTLERCRIRPYFHVKKLVANPYFRLRVGDLRVILNIIDKKLVVIVIEIGQRKNIYKNKK